MVKRGSNRALAHDTWLVSISCLEVPFLPFGLRMRPAGSSSPKGRRLCNLPYGWSKSSFHSYSTPKRTKTLNARHSLFNLPLRHHITSHHISRSLQISLSSFTSPSSLTPSILSVKKATTSKTLFYSIINTHSHKL